MENKHNHFFYVLKCRDGTFYGGYTSNLQRRIKQHNEGKGAKYTRGRTPVELLYWKAYATKGEALRAEYQFKQLKRKDKERFIEKARDHDEQTKELRKE
ncbi:GIY-YIG nuclease family protein [Aeribacillus pallidus]|jgi:putative endonuclease|uniref:GIY-YIG nuclease family protein n=1 Tax=Aeribacillus pallidus TaxID=33936 RepID=UPI001D4C87BA|nr:GIY-YIG nuclease family protein [Bacillus sp. (in: firmicutes)]